MAISDFNTFISKCKDPDQIASIGGGTGGASGASVQGNLVSHWRGEALNGQGAIPSTAAVPSSTIAGAIGQHDGGSGALRLMQARIAQAITGDNPRIFFLVDRLSHQGGLSGTTTGAQTTNLPTAALTRYTSGVGVFAAIEVYTAIGTTATTVTVSYTNSAGTSGRTSIATIVGGVPHSYIGRFIIVPLQSGDLGVKSVESVTLAASTVSAAGNFGVTLFKPLHGLWVPSTTNMPNTADFTSNTMFGGFPEILDGACLQWLSMQAVSAAPLGFLSFSED